MGTGSRRQQSGTAPVTTPWHRRTLVGIEIGPTGANDGDMVFFSRGSGREWVERLREANAEYGVIFLKDQNFAYYTSRAARKAPNLGERDLLVECVEAARPHGLPIIAYCQVQYDTSSWEAHPEWRMRDSEGKEIGGRLCYNSGYLEFIKALAAEMMAHEIVGFHFDMLDHGFGPPHGCWCDRCRALYQAEHGREMPKGVTWDADWERMLRFRADSNTRFCRELEAFVHTTKPGLTVDFNYHGYPPFTWFSGERPVQHAQLGDFMTAEGLPWIFGHTNPSLLSLFMAGARPQGPLQVATSRSIYNYHDYTVRPTAEMTWEVMTYMAHGLQCTFVDKAYYDGTVDPLVYERLAAPFAEARRKRSLFGGEPVREVGIYYSERSRDWFAREDVAKYSRAFVGAHRAMMQAHIPMGVLLDESATLERLREYPVVLVPNAAIVTESEAALFEQYVSGGGQLIVTGLTGCYDRWGKPRDHCILEGLIGARLVRIQDQHPDNYARFPTAMASGETAGLVRDIRPDWALFTWGPLAAYEPTEATGYGELLLAHRSKEGVTNIWAQLMSPNERVGPALLVRRYGMGRVVTAPFSLDSAFAGDYRQPEHRDLLRNLIRWLHPEPLIEIEAPASVEAVVRRDASGKQLTVHLIGFHGTATFVAGAFASGRQVLPPLMEEPLRYSARITARQPVRRASAASKSTKLTRAGNTVTVATNRIHEAVVLHL